ncbi:HAD-IIIC family phosphatase [Lacrimispora algidixylanolytica]|uniref:N-acetyltransferase domain-containing protein n=1 Tax=Lacrimispora algidixylanolytica TaxID=94868 RepID=A0A419T1R1_9FIRM|nr:HAD-IIIC family phosphatase [Lacrimispora algidixylanolytica]RKD31351.1 hypothetical protein BET01_20760 [Lacrimispora algidixylanolytica]
MVVNKIKCVVWDLDNTLWSGTLVEGDNVTINKNVVEVIKKLDERGILHSISSKNEYHDAMNKLIEFNVAEYFLFPQINWEPKSTAISTIAKSINIGIDSIAFVDDSMFEREEVKFYFKEVLCIGVDDISQMLVMDGFMPRFITEDSKNRRLLYKEDMVRKHAEEVFQGAKEIFLATLNMVFIITKAKEEDLRRVEELTIRTHQLNSTGTIYSYDELRNMIHSENYLVLIAQLNDKYGSYGKIGICVIEKNSDSWYIRLLLMSCRVASRGVGAVMINFVINLAIQSNVKLFADFVQSERNRIMYITYKFNGFCEVSSTSGKILFEADIREPKSYMDYVIVCDQLNV